MNEPYAEDGPAPGVGAAHLASGTSVFTASARIDRERSSDGVLIPPATEKFQAVMLTIRSLVVSRGYTMDSTSRPAS